jgi:hypothetical protein
MTTALLDRLTHHCHIIETGNESYRFRHSTAPPRPRSGRVSRPAGPLRQTPTWRAHNLQTNRLIHRWLSQRQPPAPGQNSIGTGGQNSVGANTRCSA